MRLAIITDIHEDLKNLQKALRKIEKYNVDNMVCLGDISGFSVPHYDYQHSRNAHECLKLIRTNCLITVLGNHDLHVAKIIPYNCSFFNFPKDWYNLDYHQKLKLSKGELWLHEKMDLDPLYTIEDIEYLKTLTEHFIFKTSHFNILFSHYIYPNISGVKKEFATDHKQYSQHFKYIKSLNCKISFTGHSHVRGVTHATEKSVKHHRYRYLNINETPVCFSLPPITRHKKRSGFCIFDTDEQYIQLVKL